jgi:hypothetical protein
MPTLWVVPPLLLEPSADALAALARDPLAALANELAEARTGGALRTLHTDVPQADWARARLRALAACLAEARAAGVSAKSEQSCVVGLGLGELAAWALCGVISDAQAMALLLALALGVPASEQLLAITVSTPSVVERPGLAVSRISARELVLEGPCDVVERTLGELVAIGDLHVQLPYLRTLPPRAALGGPLWTSALADVALHAPRNTLLLASSGEVVGTLPRTLDASPYDLVRVLAAARQLGCTALRVLGDELPGELSLPAQPSLLGAKPPARSVEPGYYIGTISERSASSFVSERVISLEREPYLRTAARLHKVCVLPGSFELEIGIEAGKLLHPALLPVAIDNAQFHNALKLFEGQPVTMRLRADSRAMGDGYHLVKLSIYSDLTHKSGRLLQRDRKHCELDVIMGPRFDLPSEPIEWDAREAVSDPDVPSILYQSGSPLWLGPYFEAVWDTERAGNVVRSTYRNPEDLTLPAFHAHLGAPLLMDAVLQNPLRQSGPYLATGIPLSIRRVRFFDLLNERDIVARHGHLVLSSVVDEALPYCERMQAATPDGRLLLEVERFETIPLGFIDRRDRSLHLTLPSKQAAPESVHATFSSRGA